MTTAEECPPPELGEEPRAARNKVTVLDLLVGLSSQKRLIIWTVGAITIGAAVVSLLLPVRYTAKATILPPQQGGSLSSALMNQLGGAGTLLALAGNASGALKNPNDQFVAMLRSRTVEDAMIDRFHLMDQFKTNIRSQARKVLEKMTAIDGDGKDGLIHISITDRDSKQAAELTNGYVDEFQKLTQHLALTEAGQRRLFFERQLADAKVKLSKAEEDFKNTQQKTGLVQLESQARALIESAAVLRAQIAAKQVQIDSLKTFATTENSQVVQAEQELQSLRAQLAKLGQGDQGTDLDLIATHGKLTDVGLEYARKLRELKFNETVYELLARQYELAKLDEAKEGAVIQVVDSAVAPDRRSSPNRVLITLGALAAAIFLAIVAAFLRIGYGRLMSDPVSASKMQSIRSSLLPFGRNPR